MWAASPIKSPSRKAVIEVATRPYDRPPRMNKVGYLPSPGARSERTSIISIARQPLHDPLLDTQGTSPKAASGASPACWMDARPFGLAFGHGLRLLVQVAAR